MMILQHRFVPVKAREGRLAVDLKGIREAWVVQVVAQCCDEHVEFFLRIRKYYVSMSGRGKKEGEGEGNDLKGIREARMVQVVAQCCDEHVEFFLWIRKYDVPTRGKRKKGEGKNLEGVREVVQVA
jgi:protein gp37